jgi:hypothetical protein
MIGGEREVVKRLDPIFARLAPGAGDIARTPGPSLSGFFSAIADHDRTSALPVFGGIPVNPPPSLPSPPHRQVIEAQRRLGCAPWRGRATGRCCPTWSWPI